MKRPLKRNKPVRRRDWTPDDLDEAKRERRWERGKPSVALPDPEHYFATTETNATVVCPYGVRAFVRFEERELLCLIHPSLTDGKRSLLAAGDAVRVEYVEGNPIIQAVAPRRNKLSRYTGGAEREHVIAANVDLLLVVASARQPTFKPGLVDRFLIAAEVGGVRPVLCINKMDLVDAEPEQADLYRQLGVPILLTSCVTGQGLDDLRRELEGKRTVFAGHSGVGKSSIVNALQPGLDIPVQPTTALEKGRHTTSSARLHELHGNIHIIDTPGIRELGLWGVSREELAFYFPEMAAVARGCRFRDCTHLHEPHCAVREAVEQGRLSFLRYRSYVRIRESM